MITPAYLEKKTQTILRKSFYQNQELPSVQLRQVFDHEFYRKLQPEILSLSYQANRQLLTHSYLTAALPAPLLRLFHSSEFFSVISGIIGRPVQKVDFHAHLFSWKDYTVLSDETIEPAGIDIIIDLTEDWPEGAGGEIIYRDQEGNYFPLPSAPNMLAIVQRKRTIQKFVKYVNHYAGTQKRVLLLGRIS